MIRAAAVVFCVVLFSSVVGAGLMPAQQPPAAASGKEILTRKCFQCHQASMWASVRGDRKEWLGVLYRMVGRGALWTEEEINAMASFLADTRGLDNSQTPNPKSQTANPKAP
jgi:cytochrome c5